MASVYVINEDATISSVSKGGENGRPWFISPAAAVIHGGVEMTCFTKEGVGEEPFPNPFPDPHGLTEDAIPERHHYFVQMTGGVLHSPPLSPAEAAMMASSFADTAPTHEFTYEPENIIPAL